MATHPLAHTPPAPETELPWRERLFPNNEWLLAGVIVLLCAVFAVTGPRFLSTENAFEIIRLAVVVGLLALAMTPVIITGGIDLSVGSMMGLGAVVLGALWRDAGVPLPAAVALTVALGALGGGLNALLIARLGFPPLIVTLGTFSLFRGVAEGVTRGIDNFTGFPASFLFLGQGYVGGVIPTQLFVLVAAVAAAWWWLHRTPHGRTLYAIGHGAEGARYAAIPVGRRIAAVYVVSGLAAGLAAVVYVAHLGQAKADAGTGYELLAITAVVLGGASIFGGRGTVLGTVLGLFSIVILQNGLRLSGQPAELAGILTGVLLVGTILLDRISRVAASRPRAVATHAQEETQVRNSQIAVLCAVILTGSLIVAASNWWLVRSLRSEGAVAGFAAGGVAGGDVPTVAMMPKTRGDPYFVSVRQGAEDAARQLGVRLLWDGPTDADPARQNEVVEAWITRGVDAIAVSVENRVAISSVLRKARERGIPVLTWDADAEPDARDFLVNQATPRGIGYTLADEAARIMGGRGEFAIITASLTAANQNEWIQYIRERIAQEYPEMRLVAIQPSDGDRDRAFTETQTVLRVHPGVRVIMGIAAPAVPGAAEAVKQSGRTDVRVTGLSLPSMCRPYIHEGIIQSCVLWNTLDLGYLTVHAAAALATRRLERGASGMEAGRLGRVAIEGDEILLGAPFVFTRENVDRFDF